MNLLMISAETSVSESLVEILRPRERHVFGHGWAR